MTTNSDSNSRPRAGSRSRIEAARVHDQIDDLYKQGTEAANAATNFVLRTTLLINAGAVISILAFLGALVGKANITFTHINDVATSILWFAAGTVFSTLSCAAFYYAQYTRMKFLGSLARTFVAPYLEHTKETGLWNYRREIGRLTTIVLSFLALMCFVIGLVDVRNSVTRIGASVTSTLK